MKLCLVLEQILIQLTDLGLKLLKLLARPHALTVRSQAEPVLEREHLAVAELVALASNVLGAVAVRPPFCSSRLRPLLDRLTSELVGLDPIWQHDIRCTVVCNHTTPTPYPFGCGRSEESAWASAPEAVLILQQPVVHLDDS